MPQLKAPFLPELSQVVSLPVVSNQLDKLERHEVAYAPWPEYPARPAVQFTIAHTNNYLLLKYYVREPTMLARYKNSNDPVYRDSCVEFFVAFNQEPAYYNLEFNSLGTCLAGFGPNREQRVLLAEPVISLIQHQAVITSSVNEGEPVSWQLTLLLPKEVFCYHCLPALGGERCRVNFYKCGDDLPNPHFLCWAPVTAPSPDFHLPEFFGELELAAE